MQTQSSAPCDGIIVAHGYGLKLYVDRGHLVVHDGVCDERETRRYNRATSRLKRIVVIGHNGFVTLEALRWIRDVGAAFVQIDRDGSLVTVSANKGGLDSWRRRAQAKADLTGADLIVMRSLLAAKIDGQATVAHRLRDVRSWLTHNKGRQRTDITSALVKLAREIRKATTFAALADTERVAARYYWKAWRDLPVTYSDWWTDRLPEHWQTAGTRSVVRAANRGRMTSPRHAITPVMAMINYTYAILAAEATITAHEFGLDPGLGFMHTNRRHQRDLISDLMEPGRPIADGIVLDLLASRTLDRDDVHETRDGRCRLGPALARELTNVAPQLYEAIQPHCFGVVKTLAKTTKGIVPTRARRVGTLL